MEMIWKYEKTVTFNDVYQCDHDGILIPDGYESAREFRLPKKGEVYLSDYRNAVPRGGDIWNIGHPRLILRKKPVMRTVTVEVEEGCSLIGVIVEGAIEPAGKTVTTYKLQSFFGMPVAKVIVG